MSPGFAMVRKGFCVVACSMAAALTLGNAALAEPPVSPKTFDRNALTWQDGDVVAFVGGSDVAAAAFSGHLEALLAAASPRIAVRFRNFGWEGDTVYDQPRDVGFPPLLVLLQRAQASVVVLQFGRMEALDGRDQLPRFLESYRKLAALCAQQTSRLILVTPPPLEAGKGSLPDLSRHNGDLGAYAAAIRELAHAHGWLAVDLFTELGAESHAETDLTDNGLQLSPRGHALVAAAFVRRLGLPLLAEKPGVASANGTWSNPAFERLRQAVIEKNRLWSAYWRPQNWAFLGGDRVSQPSSRDHKDPSIRWFPAEMEKYPPLIAEREKRMAVLVRELSP